MEDNKILYNAGFKSYEITKCRTGTEHWYEWVERSRNLMRRVKISLKVLRWLVSVFIEAAKQQGNITKRWNMKDHFSDFFCTLKYNENGRYISFIAIQGQSKSVIIKPESIFKGGWGTLPTKLLSLSMNQRKPRRPKQPLQVR